MGHFEYLDHFFFNYFYSYWQGRQLLGTTYNIFHTMKRDKSAVPERDPNINSMLPQMQMWDMKGNLSVVIH